MDESASPDDVRMKGFARRSTVAEALAWLDAHVVRLGEETVPLAEAAGRVLAREVQSSVNVPGFDRAMMDGFAVRAADTLGASPYNRIALTVIGESLPGRPFAGGEEASAGVPPASVSAGSARTSSACPARMRTPAPAARPCGS